MSDDERWAADQKFLDEAIARGAEEKLGLNLLARQRDKTGEPPVFWQILLDKTRKPIEGVISVLTECFGIEHVLARTGVGLFRIVPAKATTFSLVKYFARALGKSDLGTDAFAV